MSDNLKKKLRLLYGILLAVMLTVTGVLLMIACVNVYNIGDRPFTADNIAAEFSKVAVVVWITLAMVAIGAILSLILPEEKAKLRATVDKKAMLARFSRRIDLDALSDEVYEKLEAEKFLCKGLRIEAIEIIAIAAIAGLVYILNPDSFTADHDASVLRACVLILPLTFFSLGIALAYTLIESASINRQLTLVKSAMATAGIKTADTECKKEAGPWLIIVIRIAVAVAAIAFIVLGILNGGIADVLAKAINICTECIGLG